MSPQHDLDGGHGGAALSTPRTLSPRIAKTESDDGRCIVCSGELIIVEHQSSRDWGVCRYCGLGQGVARRIDR